MLSIQNSFDFFFAERKNLRRSKGIVFKFGRSPPERYFMTTQIVPTLSDNVDLLVWSWNSVKQRSLFVAYFFA